MKRAGEVLGSLLRRCANGHSGPAYEWEGSGRYLCRRCRDDAQAAAQDEQAGAREKARLDDNRKRQCRKKHERQREYYQNAGYTLHDVDDKRFNDGRFVFASVSDNNIINSQVDESVTIHTIRVNAARCVDAEDVGDDVLFEQVGSGLTASNEDRKGQALSPDTLFISDFSLKPNHQNSGIGSAIMEVFFEYVDRLKVNAVYGNLAVADIVANDGDREINEKLRKRLIYFYHKRGFDVMWLGTEQEQQGIWGRIDWHRGNQSPGRLLHTD